MQLAQVDNSLGSGWGFPHCFSDSAHAQNNQPFLGKETGISGCQTWPSAVPQHRLLGEVQLWEKPPSAAPIQVGVGRLLVSLSVLCLEDDFMTLDFDMWL